MIDYISKLMFKYRVFSVRELRKVATHEEIAKIDKELLEKIRGV